MKAKYVMLFMIALILSACGQAPETKVVKQENDTLMIYTSIYPLYDFAQKIAGDRAVVQNLVPPGVEAHDFEPKARQMAELNDADLLIYNGAGFESWVEKARSALNSDRLLFVDASQDVELLVEEVHPHAHEMWDPHVWLDPNRAKRQAETIARALIEIDPEHRMDYERNFQSLSEQFDELDRLLRDLNARANKKELVVSHASFGYLTEAYGFKQIAIAGLSPASEPTQRELQEIIERVKASDAEYILFEKLVSGKIAKVVQRETGAEALMLHPIENVTEEEIEQGKDYFAIMKDNIEALKKALDYQ